MKFEYSYPHDNDIETNKFCSRKTGGEHETENEFPITRL